MSESKKKKQRPLNTIDFFFIHEIPFCFYRKARDFLKIFSSFLIFTPANASSFPGAV